MKRILKLYFTKGIFFIQRIIFLKEFLNKKISYELYNENLHLINSYTDEKHFFDKSILNQVIQKTIYTEYPSDYELLLFEKNYNLKINYENHEYNKFNFPMNDLNFDSFSPRTYSIPICYFHENCVRSFINFIIEINSLMNCNLQSKIHSNSLKYFEFYFIEFIQLSDSRYRYNYFEFWKSIFEKIEAILNDKYNDSVYNKYIHIKTKKRIQSELLKLNQLIIKSIDNNNTV